MDLGTQTIPRSPLPPMSISEKYVGSTLVVAATVVALAMLRRQWASRRTTPYPPGPKGYPIIGNVFDVPKNPIWEGFAKMAQEYGERFVLLRLVPRCSRLGRLTSMDRRDGHLAPGYNGYTSGRAEQQRCGHRSARAALGCVCR